MWWWGHPRRRRGIEVPHMPIGKVRIYRLLFVCVFCLFVRSFVCTVTDFSAEDKASGVKFCTTIRGPPRQGIPHFGELCSPEAQNQTSPRGPRAGRFVR